MIDTVDKPVQPSSAWTTLSDDSSSLRSCLAYLFSDDDRVVWETDDVGSYTLNGVGLKIPVDAIICNSCLTLKLFDVFSNRIFKALMPTTPEFLHKANVAYDSSEGELLINEFQHDAFGFQLLFASLYGWNNMTPYLHIVGVHSAEFIRTFGSVGLWSQGAFEAAHKIFRSQMAHTSHDGGRNSRTKITRELQSQQALQVDLRELDTGGASGNCSLKQALLRTLRYQMFDTRYELDQQLNSQIPLSITTTAARRLLQIRYSELDGMLPQECSAAKRTVKQLMNSVTPQAQEKTKRLLEEKVEAKFSRDVRRRLNL